MFETVLIAIDINDRNGATHVANAALELIDPKKAVFHVLNVVPDTGMAIVGNLLGPDHPQKILELLEGKRDS